MKKNTRKIAASFAILAISFGFISCLMDDDANHTHKFFKSWSCDENYHWHSALCEHTSEKSNYEKHWFKDWETIKEPTESSEGLKEKKCRICPYVVYEVTSKLKQ